MLKITNEEQELFDKKSEMNIYCENFFGENSQIVATTSSNAEKVFFGESSQIVATINSNAEKAEKGSSDASISNKFGESSRKLRPTTLNLKANYGDDNSKCVSEHNNSEISKSSTSSNGRVSDCSKSENSKPKAQKSLLRNPLKRKWTNEDRTKAQPSKTQPSSAVHSYQEERRAIYLSLIISFRVNYLP